MEKRQSTQYILNISDEIDLNLKLLILQDLERYLDERNFSINDVPCYGLKQALNEILPVYGCKQYFSLTSIHVNNDVRDGAFEWYVEEFKLIAKRFNPNK